jgi:hypothetical protein
MCQLITRCPIRDSSSISVAALAAVAAASDEAMGKSRSRSNINTSENNGIARMIIDEGNNNNVKKEIMDLQKLQQQQKSSDDLLLSQHQHNQVAALMAAHQQQRIDALTNSFQIMEKARQEQQLQQFQVQQFEAHRIHQLQLQLGIPRTRSYVPGMPLAGTDHSNTNMASQISTSRSSSTSPVLEKMKVSITANFPHSVLDSSNRSSLTNSNVAQQQQQHDAAAADPFAPVTPTSTKQGLYDSERLSMFQKEFQLVHKEFQFPWKLYEMLEKADQSEFSHLVSWMPGDLCFKVHDTDTFVQLVMPRFFKQTKYKR